MQNNHKSSRPFQLAMIFVLACLAGMQWACGDDAGRSSHYQATIRRTTYGVPHILADDLPGAAFGLGYAFAEDNLCILADQIVKVRGQRARYFGPGDENANITSDFAYLALGVYPYAQDGYASLAPDLKAVIDAYAAGYNKFLADRPPEDLAPECRNQEWVTPIDGVDLLAYYLDLALLASARNFTDYIAGAAPPGVELERGPQPEGTRSLPNLKALGAGSNGWALGRDRTESGYGMLLSNTHFPYEGELRWYENHITVPGLLNIMGVSLMGVPAINIGFTENLAWTHTVSDSMRFTVYKLSLSPDDPLTYLVDGSPVAMTAHDYEIQVLQENGTIEPLKRTLYRSEHGVLVEFPGVLDWSATTAYTLKDANENKLTMIDQWLAMDLARNLTEFKAAFEDHQGIPWVNTLAVDSQGNTFYIDASSVPNLSAQTEADLRDGIETDLWTAILWDMGVPLLDGSDGANDWVDEGTLIPGLVPPEKAPRLERTDFVANSNDNHWLTNPAYPLEGFSILYGEEGTQRSLRTRLGLIMLEDQAGANQRFSFDELRDAMFSNRTLGAELLQDDLAERCATIQTITLEDGTSVAISQACDLVRDWDGRVDIGSTGAVVFREFMSRFSNDMYLTPFDAGDPVNTPNGMAVSGSGEEDPVLLALAEAVADLSAAGVALDANLGDIQFFRRADQDFKWHGGNGIEGAFNIASFSTGLNTTLLDKLTQSEVIDPATDLTTEGYLVNFGSSYIMIVEFGPDGPHAEAVLVYSQSSNPQSPHFADQCPLYTQKTLRRVPFTEAEIAADPNLSVEVIRN